MTTATQEKTIKSPIKAIRQFCIKCIGGRESAGFTKRIKECGFTECDFFVFRFGKNPFHTQNLTAEQRKERGERLKSSI